MQPYKQTTEFTGAAASLLMVINHFKPSFGLNQENEFKIWLKTVNLPTRASSIFGIASFAHEQGLKIEVYAEKLAYDYPDYRFKGYKKEEISSARISSEIHRKEFEKQNIKVHAGEFSLENVKQLLKQNKIIMLRLDAGIFRDVKPSSSYVVFTEFAKKYTIYDPYSGKIEVEEEKVIESFNDLVTKRKRDHRMIVFG